MRCGRCGRTSCACCWSWPSSRAARCKRSLDAALHGPIDGGSVNALWELTRGNALFLRELVRHGVDRGLLAPDGGVWRWRGDVTAGTRLAELVDLRIEDAGTSGRRVLELVAVGAPLEVGLLEPAELAA